jgi:hypothetical protein
MRQATIAAADRPERPHCSRGEGQDQRENEQRKHRFRLKSRPQETCLVSLGGLTTIRQRVESYLLLPSSSSCSNQEVNASIKYVSIKAREFVVVPLAVATLPA